METVMTDATTQELIPQYRACAKLGGISRMTLRRWRANFPDFPEPITINGRNYFDVAELDAWLERQRAKEAAAA
jgi:predicted DNA-binding transcriptional regulator AlpA